MSSSNRLFSVSSEAFECLAQSLSDFFKISPCTEPTNRKKSWTLGPVDMVQADVHKNLRIRIFSLGWGLGNSTGEKDSSMSAPRTRGMTTFILVFYPDCWRQKEKLSSVFIFYHIKNISVLKLA
jgi:hypothetical protein